METVHGPDRVVLDPPEVVRARIKKRRLRALRRVVTVSLLGAFLGASIYIANYQPLTESNVWGCGLGARAVEHIDTLLSPGECVMTVHPGDLVGYGFTLHNDGPLAIHIRSIGADQRASVKVGDARIFDDRRAAPFRPFSLPPGSSRSIYVYHPVKACFDGTLSGWDTVTILTKVFGIPRSDEWTLPRGVVLKGGDGCS